MGGLGAVLAVFRTFAAAAVDDGAEVEDITAKMFPDGVGRLAQFFQRFPAEGYQFFSGAGTASEHPGKAVSYTHLDVYKRQAFSSAPSRMVQPVASGSGLEPCGRGLPCLLYTSRCV